MRRSLGLVAGVMVVMVGACDGGEDPLDSIGLRVTSSSGSVVLTLAAIEGGAALAIGVSLDGEPQEPFVVELAADPLVALDRTTLTFTAEDYDRPQPVVITAVDDVDVVDGAGDIVLSSPGADRLVVPIAIADDDGAAIVGIPDGLMIMEAGTAGFAIALAADPGGPVTITLASSDATSATVAPATLTFAANWAVPQNVTVTAPADADDLDDDVAIALGGLHVTATTVPLVVLDDERQNFVIAPGALALTEGGAAGSVTVRLTQPPTGTLAIAVAVDNPAIAAVSTASLAFTAANYSVPQSITVSPRADIDGLIDASILRLTSSGLRERSVGITMAEDAVADLPDIDGDFLMSIRPTYSNGPVVRYRITYTGDPITAAIVYRAHALRVDDGQPIGGLVEGSDVVRDDATFLLGLNALVPAAANPFAAADELISADVHGRIVSADLLCGTMTPLGGDLLDFGTTWGAVRITGSTLPDPIAACPAP